MKKRILLTKTLITIDSTRIIRFIIILVTLTSSHLQIYGQVTRPHVVFLAGEEEYGAHWTLPKIADDLEKRFNVKTTVIHSWRSGVHDYDMPGDVQIPQYDTIENLEIIKEADLLVMHIRFRIPPPEQYQMLQEYFDSGKPAIAFRTTSHGFWPAEKKGWFVPFFGGHYKGHMPNSDGTTTLVPAEQLDHPILRGVPKKNAMNDVMGIYVTAPLNDTATPLMMGKTGLEAPAQPVTWINEYKKGQKIFYTSLGGLESFIDPGFINMVYNAIYWALDREVPENGVLGMNNLSIYEKGAPFEQHSFGAIMPNPFNRPESELELEHAKVLDADFKPMPIPPAPKANIPEKAVVLFDGNDLSKWRHWDLSTDPVAMLPDARAVSPSPDFKTARWPVFEGIVEARPGFGSLLTNEEYGNYMLHLDFLIPEEPDYVPQKYKGSGGIYLDGRYEIKIMDSYGVEPSKTSNGAIFNQVAPSTNPSMAVNTWQSMDIEYRQNQGQRPQISVTLNGVKIHDNQKVLRRSAFAIREDVPLFISTEQKGSGAFNMNKDNWSMEIEFQTPGEGVLISNAPKNTPWNKDSKGIVVDEGKLYYHNGNQYKLLNKTITNPLRDGEVYKLVLSAADEKVTMYLNGKRIDQFENCGAATLEGHVLRIGQGAKIFMLGASELPVPYNGETFDGEIKKVRFYNRALKATDILNLQKGEPIYKKSIVLDWALDTAKISSKPKKGPIRIQSDLSKLRYANIWLLPLEE